MDNSAAHGFGFVAPFAVSFREITCGHSGSDDFTANQIFLFSFLRNIQYIVQSMGRCAENLST